MADQPTTPVDLSTVKGFLMYLAGGASLIGAWFGRGYIQKLKAATSEKKIEVLRETDFQRLAYEAIKDSRLHDAETIKIDRERINVLEQRDIECQKLVRELTARVAVLEAKLDV